MNILLNLKEALQSLNANKLRSLLTILGIVIGVASVIALLSIGESAGDSITGEIESIGTNVIYILSGNDSDDVTNPKDLTLQDAEALANSRRAPEVAYVAPVISGGSEISYGAEGRETSISGVTPDYQFVQNITMAEGDFISEAQVEGRSAVVVLGPEIAQNLLGRSSGIIGSAVRIGGYPFRVIGVTEAKGGSAFNNPDNNVFIPISTAQTRLPHGDSPNAVQFILVSVAQAEDADQAIQQITDVLRSTHRIPPRSPNDFSILNQQDFLAVAASITNVLTIFLGGIGAISLLVGGIGIMNIMLVSVTERTREIGLRKALGARKKDILLQFLTESVLLSMIGGLLGIALGWAIALVVSQIATRSGTPLEITVTANSVLLATLFSAAVGIFFGYYPANRAASLAPVEALRYE
ncbi:MAG: ABC transporter permease [Brevefilum sp.]|nr:ABC transporter permease [Brevefilum sp.]MDT8382129.1 ABC transporter permease [Brevefilum sp.]MDW7755262.1 ABC transporter permease [Brevefilum sp.]